MNVQSIKCVATTKQARSELYWNRWFNPHKMVDPSHCCWGRLNHVFDNNSLYNNGAVANCV